MDKQIRTSLWTHDFTTLALGTVTSAIADVAMSFIMSVIVYVETSSAFLSGLFFALGLVPNIIIPILSGPFVDGHYKKNFIVICDVLMAILFLCGYVLFGRLGFNYILFLIFDLVCGCIGGVYQIAFQAYFPSLIPEGFEEKGYSVSSMIYPTVSVIFTPLAAVIYNRFGMPIIMLIIGICLLLSAFIESFIRNKGPKKDISFKEKPMKTFLSELKFASGYLKKEKGLEKWYRNVALGGGMWKLRELMAVSWFTINPLLGLVRYSYLSLAEFAGRSIGGFFNYNVKIRNEHKTPVTIFVYSFYELCDSLLLFVPYPVMLTLRSLCGFCGINTAVLRESAVQSYIPEEDRGKINSLLSVRSHIVMAIMATVGGAMGDYLGIRETVLIACAVGFLSIFLNVFLNRKEISRIFASVKEDLSTAKFII